MIISLLAALIGILLTGVQSLLINVQGFGICLNEGCEIVDSLTTIDPLYFNLAGFIFFLLLFLVVNRARKGSETARNFASLLLLAALAAEAVLYSFQLFITELYCSYCLIILALIVIANLFMGVKQIFKGAIMFSAVFIAFAALDFTSAHSSDQYLLQDGALARYEAELPAADEVYLFFSSTCTYCEEIIETLKTTSICTINFNPIDAIDSFTFPGAVAVHDYRPEINREFLKALTINEVPVLLAKKGGILTITTGAQAINAYLEQNCLSAGEHAFSPDSIEQTRSELPELLLPQDDACSITEDCDEPTPPSTENR